MKSPMFITMQSPLGIITLTTNGEGITALGLPTERAARNVPERGAESNHDPLLLRAKAELTEYFAGTRTAFTVPLDPDGTPFQKRVWEALRTIPFGETRSYRDIADMIGQPTATRAVGLANGRNPIGIIVPCHRVIGRDGSLTGYAGGLPAKSWLLEHEGVAVAGGQTVLFDAIR
jgi:methylated-DNA-[protein]-cysteine S-methyltransferase